MNFAVAFNHTFSFSLITPLPYSIFFSPLPTRPSGFPLSLQFIQLGSMEFALNSPNGSGEPDCQTQFCTF